MNLHRYKAKISAISTGESEFEFLGTWIGFAGMLVAIIDIIFFSHPREAVGLAGVIVGPLCFFYWVTTQHNQLIFIFNGICTIVVVLLTVILFLGHFYKLQLSAVINLYLVYIASISIIAAFYGKKFTSIRS
ncbi:hypothetical protein ACFO4O_16330 [Glaciecola siphonariae]|uniref:Uncharacterized protein n=1 Tax=Glaciecola siphonariae TaxID=521012 RepID=A0ABV9M001_9ALTE